MEDDALVWYEFDQSAFEAAGILAIVGLPNAEVSADALVDLDTRYPRRPRGEPTSQQFRLQPRPVNTARWGRNQPLNANFRDRFHCRHICFLLLSRRGARI